jgi:hypothetical protein
MSHARKFSLRIVVPVLAALIVIPLVSSSAQGSLTAVVPAYFYPGTGGTQGFANGWDQLDAAAPAIPVQAIVNPASGPGTVVDPNYTTAIDNLAAAGGQPIGYVYTQYGTRSLTAVESDINTYLSFYPKITGIFIDQMSTDPSLVSSYYAPLYQYVKNAGPSLTVVANPGTNTSEAYVTTPTADKLIVFEGSMSSYLTYTPSSWMAHYSPTLFGNIIYDVPTVSDMQQVLAMAVSNDAGSAYVTDQPLNPPMGYLYDRMPSYWNEEVAALASLNPAPEPSSLALLSGALFCGAATWVVRRYRTKQDD